MEKRSEDLSALQLTGNTRQTGKRPAVQVEIVIKNPDTLILNPELAVQIRIPPFILVNKIINKIKICLFHLALSKCRHGSIIE